MSISLTPNFRLVASNTTSASHSFLFFCPPPSTEMSALHCCTSPKLCSSFSRLLHWRQTLALEISVLALLFADMEVSFWGTVHSIEGFSKASNPAAALQMKACCWRAGASLYVPTRGFVRRHTEENVCSGTSPHTSHMWPPHARIASANVGEEPPQKNKSLSPVVVNHKQASS